jgi:2'-hydroxyisoflavone reductase
VLGGTSFLGRAVVVEALAAGHHITLFNRGITNPSLFPGVERRVGDRTSDVSALAHGRWDAVIDVAAYHSDAVRRTADVLADSVDHYVFVSTLSVYADHRTTESQTEDARLWDLDTAGEPGERYGAHKAVGEHIVTRTFADRATVARAGLIVGPHDRTERFVYWPRRLAEGGRILAPGQPDDPLQFIDVRDLAGWLVRAATTGLLGTFNVTGPQITFGHLLGECRVPGVDAEITWIASQRLLEVGVAPWMGVPLWIAAPGWDAANAVDTSRATQSGLSFRSLADTIAGALAHPGDTGPSTFTRAHERELLTRLAP